MKISITPNPNANFYLVLVDTDKTVLAPSSLPEGVRAAAQSIVDAACFRAKSGTFERALHKTESTPCHVGVYCIDKQADEPSLESCELGAKIYRAVKNIGHGSVSILNADPKDIVQMAKGAKLAAYEYNTYKTKLKPEDAPTLDSLELISAEAMALQNDWAIEAAIVEGTYFCRDLVNAPPSHLYPETFAKELESLREHGVKVTLIPERELAAMGMHAMLGVGQGSVRDSYMVQMEWAGGADGTDPVVLVGKGVCFDAGGISLKPGAGMQDMRGDMGGAAAVSGAMLALAKSGAKANVVGLVGLVENMPDGNAIRPGDILHSASGQTIEVQNTDAEGRLVLCDVLWYAQENFTPAAIVDLATLTGAIVVSLGHEYAGLFSHDDSLAAELSEAGKASGEGVWRFPLGKRYDNLLKSKFADMRNIGGRAAGSITAAQFLGRFVKDGVRWAHLDIAGVAWVDGDKKATDPSWASGFGPGLLVNWINTNYSQ